MVGEIGAGEAHRQVFDARLGEVRDHRRVVDIFHGDGEGLQGEGPGRVLYPQGYVMHPHVALACRAAQRGCALACIYEI